MNKAITYIHLLFPFGGQLIFSTERLSNKRYGGQSLENNWQRREGARKKTKNVRTHTHIHARARAHSAHNTRGLCAGAQDDAASVLTHTYQVSTCTCTLTSYICFSSHLLHGAGGRSNKMSPFTTILQHSLRPDITTTVDWA